MTCGFVETRNRRPGGRKPDGNQPSVWTVIFMGCVLINSVTISFIPMSQISSFDVSLLFLVLVVLPLLFLSLFLATKFGYGILFAAFLSIPGGITSVLVLGDFSSLVMGRNVVEGIQVREATYYSLAKVFEFRSPVMDLEKIFHSIQVNTFRERAGGASHTPPIYHSLVPVLDIDQGENEEISVFAVCTHSDQNLKDCGFYYPDVKGGIQVPENLRILFRSLVRENAEFLGRGVKNSPIFLFWIPKSKERILHAGYYGLIFVFFLNFIWAASVILYYSLRKKI